MIKVNPVKLNSYNQISFKDNNTNNMTPNVAVLSLQNPNALINFQRDFSLSKSADAVQSNPFKALGYKFVRLFKFLSQPKFTEDYIGIEDRKLYELI
jgi:hypothetical protein